MVEEWRVGEWRWGNGGGEWRWGNGEMEVEEWRWGNGGGEMEDEVARREQAGSACTICTSVQVCTPS